MPKFESFPHADDPDRWKSAGVHWHAFTQTRVHDEPARTADRIALRERVPEVVLRTPLEVASWIDQQTRVHGTNRKVWATSEGAWVAIGDEDDLEHLRRENFGIASRGDSIYTDIYSEPVHHDVYVEAVTDEQCVHRCATGNPQ